MVVRLLRRARGHGRVGARIPSERDLARDWGVARMTVRNAIEELDQGRSARAAPRCRDVRRRSRRTPRRSVCRRSPTTCAAGAASRRTGCSSSPCSVTAGSETSVRLGVDDDEPVYRFTRLRLADGQPIAVETNWIPVDVVPDLDEAALEGSLFAAAQRALRDHPGEATSTIDAVLPDAATAAALGIGEHARACASAWTTVDQRRRPLMAADRLLRRVALSTPGHPQRQRLRPSAERGAAIDDR